MYFNTFFKIKRIKGSSSQDQLVTEVRLEVTLWGTDSKRHQEGLGERRQALASDRENTEIRWSVLSG